MIDCDDTAVPHRPEVIRVPIDPADETPGQASLRISVSRAAASATTVLTVAGDLDECTDDELTGAVADCLRRHPGPLRLDLRDVGFLGSAGVRTLLLCRESVLAAGYSLELSHLRAPVHRVLEVVNLLAVFGLTPGPAHGGTPPRRRAGEPLPPSTPAETIRRSLAARRDAHDAVLRSQAVMERVCRRVADRRAG